MCERVHGVLSGMLVGCVCICGWKLPNNSFCTSFKLSNPTSNKRKENRMELTDNKCCASFVPKLPQAPTHPQERREGDRTSTQQVSKPVIITVISLLMLCGGRKVWCDFRTTCFFLRKLFLQSIRHEVSHHCHTLHPLPLIQDVLEVSNVLEMWPTNFEKLIIICTTQNTISTSLLPHSRL